MDIAARCSGIRPNTHVVAAFGETVGMWLTSRSSGLTSGAAPARPSNAGDPIPLDHLDDPIEFFHRHGFSCARGIASPHEALAAGPVVQALQEQTWGQGDTTTEGRQQKRSLLWRIDEAPLPVLRLFTSPATLDLVFAAHQTTNVRFAAWVIFHRPGGSEGTFWHSDAGHMALEGNIVQFWMPLSELPNGQGLKFKGNLGDGEQIYTFSSMNPGDVTMHRQSTPHAGQTYAHSTTGLSFITFEDGARLEDHDFPVFHQARLQMLDRLFPGASFGDAAESEFTPYLRDVAAQSA